MRYESQPVASDEIFYREFLTRVYDCSDIKAQQISINRFEDTCNFNLPGTSHLAGNIFSRKRV